MLQKGFLVTREKIQDLTNPQKLRDFFSHLGYNGAPRRLEQDAHGAFRSDEIGRFHPYGSLNEQVQGFFTLGERMDEEYARSFFVLLYVVPSVNAEVRKEIFQDLLNAGGEFLFVLADTHFRTLEFSYLDREAQAMQGQLLASSPGDAPARRTGRAPRERARLRSYAFDPRNLRWPDARSERVTLRMLKNLDWPAERDIFAQCRRLKGAFDLADWSEEFFNNHSLFSDHFLLDLKEDDSQVWQATTQPGEEQRAFDEAFRELRALYEDAREELHERSVEECRRRLIEPVLSRLGFLYAPFSRSAGRPHDYELSLPNPRGLPTGRVAILLAYAWGRDLDGYESEDPTRQTPVDRPDENPGAMVVARLEETGAEWAMLTNGQVWRLYSTRAYSRATNYYEIDLAETLSLPLSNSDEVAEAKDALRYFWLIFRARAFLSMRYAGGDSPQTFLEYLLQRGQERALKLGNDLKDRVFKQIFPHLAQGFILHAQQQGLLRLDTLSEQERADELARYFEGTLGLLFRLLFVLYAESRNLLPLRDRAAYYPHSLAALKDAIAEQTRREPRRSVDPRQSAREETDEKIKRVYSPESYALYEHLLRLFRAIDQGDPALNLPTYDGGLFLTMTEKQAREEEQRLAADAEARAREPLDRRIARFLALHRVPDQYLALGLDALARDVQPKPPHLLMMIDYKSLGVRQLGSIYEGLLEFKLRVATVPMAVVRGKNKGSEEFLPYAEALESGRTLVRKGPRKNDEPLVYQPGTAYIENDRRERKATGSYYTPDYIVQYIIEQTVGPVLDAHERRFLPRFRELEQAYVQKKRQRQTLDDAPEKIFFNQLARSLVDEFFEISVLDPAMGSGHFLVAAVDYITDRLLRFLKGVPHNPVRYTLERTREEIAREMEQQHIQFDAASLTEVNLLKRQVLKRCIYGVDLNPMAVLLARVSVWLDSFTRGAPLSFLDHHLKWGNSLIGTRIEEARKSIEEGQLSIFGNNLWASVLFSTGGMIRVSKLSDVTIEQARESNTEYERAVQTIAPYKRLLDVYLSRWFSNLPVITKKQKSPTDKALDFLRSNEAEQWLAHPEQVQFTEEQQSVLSKAIADSNRYSFFHWELEFPEIFIDLERNSIKENPGFDVVVGNPPYDELSEFAIGRALDEVAFFERNAIYGFLGGGRLNWYHYFVVLATHILRTGGMNGFIVPMSLMSDQFTFNLRQFLLDNYQIQRFDVFPQKDDPKKRIFFEAKLSTCIYTLSKRISSNPFLVRTHAANVIDRQSPSYLTTSTMIGEINEENLSIPLVSNEGWQIIVKMAKDTRLDNLSKVAAKPTSGEIVFNQQFRKYLTEDSNYTLILRGSHIQRYDLADEAKQGEPLYLRKDLYLQDAKPGSKAFDHLYERVVYQEGAAIDNWRRIIATLLPAGLICGHKICYFTDYKIAKETLLAIFNSKLINWYVTAISTNNSLSAYLIGSIPFPIFESETSGEYRLLSKLKQAYLSAETNSHGFIVSCIKQNLTLTNFISHDIHDFLAYLAQIILDLNKEKRALQQGFVEEFETILDIRGRRYKDGRVGLEAWQNRERIKNFAGDYQKGEEPLSEDELIAIIRKNRAQWAASFTPERERRVRDAYARALPDALRLKDRLAATDRLIDRVVYALYGLTDEEIALVEGG